MTIEGKLQIQPVVSEAAAVADELRVCEPGAVDRVDAAALEVYAMNEDLEVDDLLRYCRGGRSVILTSRGIPIARITQFPRLRLVTSSHSCI